MRALGLSSPGWGRAREEGLARPLPRSSLPLSSPHQILPRGLACSDLALLFSANRRSRPPPLVISTSPTDQLRLDDVDPEGERVWIGRQERGSADA